MIWFWLIKIFKFVFQRYYAGIGKMLCRYQRVFEQNSKVVVLLYNYIVLT